MRVLVVEDEKKTASFVRKALEGEGFAVDVCHRGDEALVAAGAAPFDGIVLDIMLPGRDGLSVLRQLRERKNTTPVLLLSARGEVNERVEGLNAGADDYLPKPFSVKELFARIRALLRRPKQTIMNKVEVGDIVIWIQRRKVYQKDQEVKLTLKEYELLEYLVLHPNEVINREAIVDKVWDMNFNSFSNVIDVHVANVRKKLQTPDSKMRIETVRGIGYRLHI